MNETRNVLLQVVEENAGRLFDLGCDIYDHPELGREEFFACGRLTGFLESEGFAVERGVGGMETAFRATWEQGSGGPAIGFIMEYDALRDLGHGCGHHLQGPAVIGAALALKKAVRAPFKLVLYGTPDEEAGGGKIEMVEQGLFRDVDVMFAQHIGMKTHCSFANKALAPQRVTFRGRRAHAGVAPWDGRSAMDAMLLAFHGLEILREHIRDGSRIHYSIAEGTGPANVVQETARADIILRADDKRYLEELRQRMENILKGACLMTDTAYEVEWQPVVWNFIPNQPLRRRAYAIAQALDSQPLSADEIPSGGSSDIGNVSWVTPTLNLDTAYPFPVHTVECMENGRSEAAYRAMLEGSKIFSWIALDCITDPAYLAEVKAAHLARTAGTGE